MAHLTRLTMCVLTLCLTRLALAGQSPVAPDFSPDDIHASVDRAIGYLQTESAAWLSQRHCAACHHAAMPMWALAEAGRQGYAIDNKFLTNAAESTLGGVKQMMASGLFNDPAKPPDTRPMARGVNPGIAFMAVAAQALPSLDEGQRQSLKLIREDIYKKQQADGGWEFFLSRPPINENQATDIAWIVMALQGETGPDIAEAHRVAKERAMEWLAKARAGDVHQVKVLKLLVAIRAGALRDTLKAAIDELFKMQRADGGWNQLDSLTSDAFATGETLYVLALAGRTADQPEMKRGIEFLLATQKADGSWPMKSRATPDGRPGSAKLLTPITCGATSWATLALAKLAPK